MTSSQEIGPVKMEWIPNILETVTVFIIRDWCDEWHKSSHLSLMMEMVTFSKALEIHSILALLKIFIEFGHLTNMLSSLITEDKNQSVVIALRERLETSLFSTSM